MICNPLRREMWTVEENNEEELIRRLKRGDYNAFCRIYDLYAKCLYAYSLQYIKQAEDAEEIVQDVFVNLWNRRDTIRQEQTLRALLFIMAKHLLINAYRAQVNQPVYEDYLNYQDRLSVEDTRYRMEYSDFLKKFDSALATLVPTQQKVVRLSRLQQWSNKEIAQHLQLSEQTVKNQLSLGMKKLREVFDKLLCLPVFMLIH